MTFKISLGLLAVSCVSTVFCSSVRFPTDDESETRGVSAGAEERYSDSQAAAVVLQPTGVKRLPHFIVPQVPSAQNPFGHINPNGYAEGIILSHPPGRPQPNRHYKPNTKMPEKMKPVQRLPYRVMSKPLGQHQTRKPLFSPKGPQPPKDIRIHPDINKHKIKHTPFSKEQDFYHTSKPDGLGLTEKEFNKLKGNKYFIKGPPQMAENHPYKFTPTPPSHDIHQQFDKNFHDKNIHMEKQSYSGLTHYNPYHLTDHNKYQEQNIKDDMKIYNTKPFVPVQEHIEEDAYIKNKDSYIPQKQTTYHGQNKQTAPQTIDSLFDYINKYSGGTKYENTKYNQFKEFSDMEEPTFDKEWLSGSEWVPIHAPAPTNLHENRVQSPYTSTDNSFSASSIYSDTFSNPLFHNSHLSYSNTNGYPNTQSLFTNTFANSISGQTSNVANIYSRPEIKINPYDLRSQIFQKPEVVMGKRPKSADINNSHEVSAVFMVKQ